MVESITRSIAPIPLGHFAVITHSIRAGTQRHRQRIYFAAADMILVIFEPQTRLLRLLVCCCTSPTISRTCRSSAAPVNRLSTLPSSSCSGWQGHRSCPGHHHDNSVSSWSMILHENKVAMYLLQRFRRSANAVTAVLGALKPGWSRWKRVWGKYSILIPSQVRREKRGFGAQARAPQKLRTPHSALHTQPWISGGTLAIYNQ